jgi:phosphopantothenoylcysteine decarboxylase/phosphopantothenate--cysteine ligase
MNQQMYAHPATQANLAKLADYGVSIWGPASGEQACGDIGKGRMYEPNELVELCLTKHEPAILAGKTITITAGPTREALDPVRFISNHSSGKMGFSLARAAKALGANVNLICGPVNLATPSDVTRYDVESAEQMHEMAIKLATHSDVFIGCAAVADYKAKVMADNKIKKQGETMTIELCKNPDIIASVAALSADRPFTVGFAAETNDVATYAKGKLKNKNLDMICANDVSNSAIGFNSDNNAMTLYWVGGERHLSLQSKQQISHLILKEIASKLA